MKAINIKAKSAPAVLTAELDTVQCKSRTREISVEDITRALEAISLPCPACKLDGTRISVDIHAQIYPSAYHGIPESTWFDAENRRGKWYITAIYRWPTGNTNKCYQVTLSDTAKAAILEHYAAF